MSASQWTFLSSHAHVLVVLAREPDLRLRDVAELIGITERAVKRIVRDLHTAGYLQISKDGRRNHYEYLGSARLRHRAGNVNATVDDLLELLQPD